jgi:uncharacterized membrane protein YdbT with pleckstrin-like domain
MRRNSPKMLAVRAFHAGKGYVPAVFVWLSVHPRLDGWQATLFTALFGIFTYTQVHSIFVDWATTRYEITQEGVHLARGLLVREETSVRWAEMASAQVSRPVVHRTLGCSMVRIGIGSQGKQLLMLEAVPDAVAAEVQERFVRYGAERRPEDTPGPGARSKGHPEAGPLGEPETGPTGGPPRPERTPGDAIYAMGKLDYFLVSITYGQFALFVPFCFGIYSQLSDVADLPRLALPEVFHGNAAPWAAGLALLVSFAVAIAFGCAVAWLRYGGFEVRVRDKALHVTGGLISRESRQVLQSQVAGLKVQQNPLMRVMGYAKLSFMSRESGSKVAANVVFPAVKLQRLTEGVAEHFPAYAALMPARPGRVFGLFGLFVLSANLLIFFSGWVVVHALRPQAVPAVLAGLALIQLILTNRIWTSVDIDPAHRLIQFHRGFLWVTRYGIPVSAVHVANESQGPVGRRLEASNLSLSVYDAHAVQLRVVAGPQALVSPVYGAVSGRWEGHTAAGGRDRAGGRAVGG